MGSYLSQEALQPGGVSSSVSNRCILRDRSTMAFCM